MYRAGIFGATLLISAAPALAQLMSVQLDYPPAELKAGIQGVVSFEVDVAKDGRVSGCRITQTSGNDTLDKQTCRQLRQTGRFKPAVDPKGRPVKSTFASKLRWTIPKPAPPTQPASAPR